MDAVRFGKVQRRVGKIALYSFIACLLAGVIAGQSVALIALENYRQTPHSTAACTECHKQAASFARGDQPAADCRQCHLPHDESAAHDAHASVACQAWHLQDVEPVRDTGGRDILWQRERHLR